MSQEELMSIVNALIIDNNTNQVTPAKVRAVMEAIISAIGATDPSVVSATAPLTYDPFTNTFSIPKASTAQDGYLAKEDFAIFGFVKPEPYLTVAPATGTGQIFELPAGFGKAGSVMKSKGELYKGTEWTQTANSITILVSVASGNSIYVKPL